MAFSSSYSLISLASDNATNVSAVSGLLKGLLLYNVSASVRYLKIYDKATAPASTDTPFLRIAIPGATTGGGNNYFVDPGLPFNLGLGFRLTTGIADNDTGSVGAAEVLVNIFYRNVS